MFLDSVQLLRAGGMASNDCLFIFFIFLHISLKSYTLSWFGPLLNFKFYSYIQLSTPYFIVVLLGEGLNKDINKIGGIYPQPPPLW